MVIAVPLIAVLFQRGAFGPEDTGPTALALAVYGAGLPAFVLQKVLQPLVFRPRGHPHAVPLRADLDGGERGPCHRAGARARLHRCRAGHHGGRLGDGGPALAGHARHGRGGAGRRPLAQAAAADPAGRRADGAGAVVRRRRAGRPRSPAAASDWARWRCWSAAALPSIWARPGRSVPSGCRISAPAWRGSAEGTSAAVLKESCAAALRGLARQCWEIWRLSVPESAAGYAPARPGRPRTTAQSR